MELRLLALVCLVGAAFAGPFQRNTGSQCSTYCHNKEDYKFNYQPGQKYVYDYRGTNYIKIAGTSKETKAEISGQVEIHVKDRCDMILQMKNIKISQNAEEEDTTALIEKLEIPMPFAFSDGKIEHTCASSEETPLSQNIKKSVLSTLINTMQRLDESEETKEVDSMGDCDTQYSSRRVRDGVLIHKEKNLKSCNNRHSTVMALMSSPYESPESSINTLPIFTDEKLVCEQEIQNRIMSHVKCSERAMVKPLRNKESAIEFQGEIELTLTHVEVADRIRIPARSQRDSILFKHGEQKDDSVREEHVEQILSEMCNKNKGVVDSTVSKSYIKLVLSVKSLSYPALERIYNALKNGRICSSKKTLDIFLDSLPMAGNDAAIELMVKLLKEGEITGLKSKLWPASLALIPQPSEKAIAAVVPLLKREKMSAPVLLGVSAMVFRYCQNSQCEQTPSVKEIVMTLQQRLGRRCSAENEDEVVAVLKAFGNMGFLGQAEQTILECAKASEKPITLRLAAIDAFRRTTTKRPMEMMDLYSNAHENFEIRIAALASVMKNAESEHIEILKRVMEHEENEQVATYAATLISNLKKTSCPLKQEMKHKLMDLNIIAPNTSYWLNSKNIELSVFNVPLNVGGGVEADIIHAPESTIPRSIYSRFDIDVFGSKLNIFELGVRAEGLEAAMRKLIGMDQKASKKQSWSLLRSSVEAEEEKSQASFFLRTMSTEILDLSVNDLTSVGNMMQFAEVMNKISHEQNADFSHSFLFMNSQLIIPSVTGRSYSFALTGSATVGLTASSKFDVVNLMSEPRNCDIHGRFQPSVNVEISATVGIHSNKPRPDIRIVTVVHSESDIETQFQVKDGHMALAKVNMPSENLVLAKISTDVLEIDAQHKEKHVVEHMQQKIDTCITALEKPLGVKLCGKLEVPRPFISRTFPFVKGIGNMELSIKKTDLAMKGFEFTVEIPKHKTPVMHYKLALDTPGSRISRRFAASMIVRKPSVDQCVFKIDLTSPFKDASASGSYTLRDDLVQGAVQVDLSQTHQYSLKVLSEIVSSGPQKTFKPVIELTFPNADPLKVGGTVVYSEGRKQQLSIDIKSNKPSRRPLALQAILMKDGSLSYARDAEWKLSSDIKVKSPFVTVQIRSATEKQARQSQVISNTLAIDYQKGSSQKHTIKLTGQIQSNLAKISSYAQYEMTQFPVFNWFVSWNTQGKLHEALKNDVTLKYGRNPDSTYINIIQTSKFSETELSECKVIVKAPQFNVDSELNVAANLNYQKNSRVQIQSDLRYKHNKHVKGLLDFHHLSRLPLTMKIIAKFECPGSKLMYMDEIHEVSTGTYEGNSLLQWKEGSKATLKYQYKKLSDRSKMHHEIDSTLRVPFIRNPLKTKASIRLSSDILEIEGKFVNQQDYFVEAQLRKQGNSHVALKVPKVEGKLNIVNEHLKKTLDVDINLQTLRPRHIVASAAIDRSHEAHYETKIQWDADRNPQRMLVASVLSSVSREHNQDKYSCLSKLQVTDIVKVDISASGDKSVLGHHEIALEVSGRSFEPRTFSIRQNVQQQHMKSTFKYSKNQVEKILAELKGKVQKRSNEVELTLKCSVKSPDNSYEDKEIRGSYLYSRSRSSLALKSELQLQYAPSKIYKTEIDFSCHENSLDLKAFLHTPHSRFEKQAISIAHQKSDNVMTSTALLEFAAKKEIALTSVIKTQREGISATCTLSTPFRPIKDAKFFFSCENRRPLKHLESYFEVNSQRQSEIELHYISSSQTKEIQGRVKTAFTPEVSAQMKIENQGQSFLCETSILKESSPIFSCKLSKKISGDDYQYTLNTKNQEQTLIDVKLVKEVSQDSCKFSLKTKAPFSPLSIALQTSRNDANSNTASLSICRDSSEKVCYNVKGYHKSQDNAGSYRIFKKLTVEVEKSSASSGQEHLCNFQFLLATGDKNYKSKLLLEARGKQLGYEVRANARQTTEEPCSLDMHVFMPSRVVRLTSSAIHNAQRIRFDFELTPDSAVPGRRLELEFQKEHQSQRQTSLLFRVNYPDMKKPLKLVGSVQNSWPVRGKLELDYSTKRNSKIILEVSPVFDRTQPAKEALLFKCYCEDKSLEVTAKFLKHISSEKDLFGYEWTYQSQRGQKAGGFSIQLFDKRAGKPHAIDVSYFTPSTDLQVTGRSSWSAGLPSEISLRVLSQKQQVCEVHYKKEQFCSTLEILRSGPFLNGKMCFNQRDGSKLKVLSVESFYKNQKMVDASLDLDVKQSNIANISARWRKDYFQQALNEMNEIVPLLQDKSLMEIEEELKEQFESVYSFFRTTCLTYVKAKYSQIIKEHKQTLKTIRLTGMRYLKSLPSCREIRETYWKPFVEKLCCIWEKSIHLAKEHLPEVAQVLWDFLKHQYESCLKKYCSRGTFCYQVQRTYQRHGFKQAQSLLIQKVKDMQHSSARKVLRVTRQLNTDFSDWMKRNYERIDIIKERVQSFFSPMFDFNFIHQIREKIEVLEQKLYEIARNVYDNLVEKLDEFLHNADRDEDYQVVKSMVIDAKKQILQAWDKREKLAEEVWEPIREAALETYPKRWIQDKMRVEKFSLQDGDIKLQIHNPLNRSCVQLLKNALQSVKSKVLPTSETRSA